VEKCKRLGIALIMDIDDHWSPGTHHPSHFLIKKNKIDIGISGNIKQVPYVTTTTPLFAKEISKMNKNVFVIPNAIDANEKQFISKPTINERIRIGYLGGSSHLMDLKIMDGIVGKIKNAGLIDKVQFVLCGFDLRGMTTEIKENGTEETRPIKPHESVWNEYEKIFTDNYSICSPEYKEYLLSYSKDEWPNVENEPYRRVWTKPITSFAMNYNLFDILLAPLENNTFNYCKSQLKVEEAAFHKKALVASDFGPYTLDCKNVYVRGGEIDLNGNAFLIPDSKNHKFWSKHLITLINNPELVKTMGENLHKSITPKYNMEEITKQRHDIYKKIMENKNK
jgi:glycosyltransferase involved in cell wall biosynthesis